jgi:hypothetical protein
MPQGAPCARKTLLGLFIWKFVLSFFERPVYVTQEQCLFI